MAVDYKRALAAYKIGAEGGGASCQHQLGIMFCKGHGVEVDMKLSVAWLEKAAAQDVADSLYALADINYEGSHPEVSSFSNARELYQKAVDLGCSKAAENQKWLEKSISMVNG